MEGSKAQLLNNVIDKLDEELSSLTRALLDSSAAATDPDSKAEGKYDTRSLEMSYLAAGQARQAEALDEGIELLRRFEPGVFTITDAVALGAEVELDQEGEWNWYFLLPAGGGVEVESEGRVVTVLTPESPLFAQVEGKRIGESLESGALVSEVS